MNDGEGGERMASVHFVHFAGRDRTDPSIDSALIAAICVEPVALGRQSAHLGTVRDWLPFSHVKDNDMATPEEYQAKAAETLVQLGDAKSDSERTRLKRAHGAYLKLATHGAEAAERAAMRPAPRIRPEKQPAESSQPTRMQSYFK